MTSAGSVTVAGNKRTRKNTGAHVGFAMFLKIDGNNLGLRHYCLTLEIGMTNGTRTLGFENRRPHKRMMHKSGSEKPKWKQTAGPIINSYPHVCQH
jgi:hypothetical protein